MKFNQTLFLNQHQIVIKMKNLLLLTTILLSFQLNGQIGLIVQDCDDLEYALDNNIPFCIEEGITIECLETIFLLGNDIIRIPAGTTLILGGTPGGYLDGDNNQIKGESISSSRLKLTGSDANTPGLEIGSNCTDCEIDELSIDSYEGVTKPSSCDSSRGHTAISLINSECLTSASSVTITDSRFNFWENGIEISGNQCNTLISDLMFNDVATVGDIDCGEGSPCVPSQTNCCVYDPDECPFPTFSSHVNAAILMDGVSGCVIENIFHNRSENSATIIMSSNNGCINNDNRLINISCEQGGNCARSILCDSSVPANNNEIMLNSNVNCGFITQCFTSSTNNQIYGH